MYVDDDSKDKSSWTVAKVSYTRNLSAFTNIIMPVSFRMRFEESPIEWTKVYTEFAAIRKSTSFCSKRYLTIVRRPGHAIAKLTMDYVSFAIGCPW